MALLSIYNLLECSAWWRRIRRCQVHWAAWLWVLGRELCLVLQI